MPLRNRVDPFGDLHVDGARGLFTGNRGCLVDENGDIVRHHRGRLWITCVLTYKNWRSPLAAPRHWTPLFFLDDAVALAAGHRPCGLCRVNDYRAYRQAITESRRSNATLTATELNRLLGDERLRRGQGLDRAADRRLWSADITSLSTGVVICRAGGVPWLVYGDQLLKFSFSGWISPTSRPVSGAVQVLTPPTSVAAIAAGYRPTIHPSADEQVSQA